MSRIVHFEIPADDPEKLMEFYKNAFGWTFAQWGTDPYWLAITGDPAQPGINGGILKRRAPDMPLVNTIGVDDIDAAIEAVEKNGGTIVVPKTTMPKMGYLCYFKDPEGTITGMMQEDPNA